MFCTLLFFCFVKKKIFWRCVNIIRLFINEEIRDRTIRLIDFDGTQLGIISIQEAREIAKERKLDLVKIAPDAKPPVCKIMDYGKYKYEQIKKEKEAKKKQKVVSVKEIRISLNIDDHDIEVKKKSLIKFIEAGHKVKLVIKFRGREIGRVKLGDDLIKKFVTDMDSVCTIEKPPVFENRCIIVVFSPISKK